MFYTIDDNIYKVKFKIVDGICNTIEDSLNRKI
jgi:hypothetical protein